MKGRLVLIEPAGPGMGARAALLVDGRLEDLLADPPRGGAAPAPEAIYAARVERRVPSLGAAFVQLGTGLTGFLRDARGAREGETLLVQAVSHPEPGKATPVTRRILHKGRLAILTPGAPGVNVARQIRREEERTRLAAAATAEMERIPTGGDASGLILRSRAEGAGEEEIAAEIGALAARAAETEAGAAGGAGLVAPAPDAAALARREWDGEVREGPGLFAAQGVEEELDRLASPRADLPSGGWMTVEPTRALVAIDVNTGGEFGGAAGLTASVEAARELPRQLRLRGLGGVIVLDPAPMPRKDRRRVEDALRTSFGFDPVETSLAGWTTLGLFEIQRKRERRPLMAGEPLC